MCNDKAYTWKALRLMAKKDVALLGQVSQPGGSLEKAVTWMHEKMKGSAKEEATDVMKAEGDAEAPAEAVTWPRATSQHRQWPSQWTKATSRHR